jgi:hypothetical protein
MAHRSVYAGLGSSSMGVAPHRAALASPARMRVRSRPMNALLRGISGF